MKVAVAADHAGFPLKRQVIEAAQAAGHEVLDLGTNSTEPVDYPDVAVTLGQALTRGDALRGVLLCGSGAGVAIAANKIFGVRAAVCHDHYSAHQAVEHDDMNVLALGARVIGPALAMELVTTFLAARYGAEERHARRVHKVQLLEQQFAEHTDTSARRK